MRFFSKDLSYFIGVIVWMGFFLVAVNDFGVDVIELSTTRRLAGVPLFVKTFH